MDPALTIEPPAKKSKLETSTIDEYMERLENRTKNLECVLDDALFQAIPTVKVYTGHIRDSKDISKAISILNERIPLKELSHLKRVRKKDIVLCPVFCYYLNGMPSIQEYLECNVQELKDMFEYFKEIEVPLTPPLLKSQFRECSKLWSCNFHPNKYLEKLVDGTVFSPNENANHTKFMLMAFEVAKWYSNDSPCLSAAVVVDPKGNNVVATAFDDRLNHPVKHAAMLAIDNVAKTQNGGAWEADLNSPTPVILRGIDSDLMVFLKEKYPVVFGAREPGENGPYLCTGYYIYLVREPCFMCAMALVHARVKRVFFSIENKELGALKSCSKLQTVSSLNHHFEVFTGFL